LNLRERYLKGRPPKSRMISEDPETRAVGVQNGPRPARRPIADNGEILIRRSAELTLGVREEPMTVTVEKLAKAIEKRMGLPHDESYKMAARVMDYFGFENFIIDNAIDPEDRKLFYALHDAGILRSSWETVLLLSGRNWRIFYWELNESDIDRILGEGEEAQPDEPVYRELPEEAWTHPPPSP